MRYNAARKLLSVKFIIRHCFVHATFLYNYCTAKKNLKIYIVFFFYQAGLALRYLGMRCDLIDDSGSMIDVQIDQEVEFRFNLMLDSLEDWKQSINRKEHEIYSLSGTFLCLLCKK